MVDTRLGCFFTCLGLGATGLGLVGKLLFTRGFSVPEFFCVGEGWEGKCWWRWVEFGGGGGRISGGVFLVFDKLGRGRGFGGVILLCVMRMRTRMRG